MIGDKFARLGVREKVGVALAAVFVVGLIADRGIVRPVRKGFLRLDTEIHSEKAARDLAIQVAEQEQTLAGEFEKVRGLLEQAKNRSEALDGLKAQISKLEAESGLSILSMEERESREARASGFYTVLAVEIGRFEARVQDLVKFLVGLQNEPGLLRVTNLSISPVRGAVGQVRGSMLITKVVTIP
ncbi:MAG: hypothetical protein ACUVWX_00550 [Kiritimatiellia bacterium]